MVPPYYLLSTLRLQIGILLGCQEEQGNNGSVEADIVVVAALSVLANTAVYKLLHAEGLVAPGGRAMNNDISYRFQFLHLL